MSFAPGDEVVCVGRQPGEPPTPPEIVALLKASGYVFPVKNNHYVVRDVYIGADGTEGVRLVEIVNPPVRGYVGEFGWRPSNFRHVRRETIEVFRQMCVSNKPLIPVGREK